MNRCTSLLHFLHLLLSTALFSAATATLAQDVIRPFPANAQRGVMQITQTPDLLLNGAPARLSPGSRIRGSNNMLVMSATLTGQTLVVNYVREPTGLLHEVWVLTEAEARVEPVKP
jgi:hypothetical protein